MKGTMHRDADTEAMIAHDVVVVGDVRLARDVNIWFGCVLRGDDEPITIGEGSNLQDGTIVHVDIGYPTVVGAGVTIGHRTLIHGTTIGDGALIGMGAILMSGSKIGEGALIGAGALVPEGMEVPPHSLVIGLPGKVRRELSAAEVEEVAWSSRHYVERARTYL
ncbi:MAG: gamma carbonic anhydrase family protein [Planctomycetota bacterium]|nr:gamma carbonic anhydrase family protein [Planctomycetota bacterium]